MGTGFVKVLGTSTYKARYYYNASGIRVKKETYTEGTLVKTIFYVGGSIYEKVEGEVIQKEITISGAGRSR